MKRRKIFKNFICKIFINHGKSITSGVIEVWEVELFECIQMHCEWEYRSQSFQNITKTKQDIRVFRIEKGALLLSCDFYYEPLSSHIDAEIRLLREEHSKRTIANGNLDVSTIGVHTTRFKCNVTSSDHWLTQLSLSTCSDRVSAVIVRCSHTQ